jgi:hypothetical protein
MILEVFNIEYDIYLIDDIQLMFTKQFNISVI